MNGKQNNPVRKPEDLSPEDFSLQIKRRAIGFIGAGVACSIVSFGAYCLTSAAAVRNQSDAEPVTPNQAQKTEEFRTDPKQQLEKVIPRQEKSFLASRGNTANEKDASISSNERNTSEAEGERERNQTSHLKVESPPSHSGSHLSSVMALNDPSKEKTEPIYENNKRTEEKQPKPIDYIHFDQPSIIQELEKIYQSVEPNSSSQNQ
jgi:hypothetical protein